MGTHIALISSALLLSTFPLMVIKFLGLLWLGSVVSLLLILSVALVARWLVLPYADPALHRLIARPRR